MLHCRQRMIEPWPRLKYTRNFEICERKHRQTNKQTCRHTDTLTTILCFPSRARSNNLENWYHVLHFQLTYFFTRHFFPFDSPLCTSITPSLSSIPGLKPTYFTNPTPVVSLLPPGLPPRTISYLFLLSYFVF